MNLLEILQELSECEPIRQDIRARSMIYQADAKDMVAAFYGKPKDTYYNLAFPEWNKLCKQYIADGGEW